jgi:CopG antitoxin of type II toxin-antitoxin system
METIRRKGLPNTDSVEELAAFWDSHDVTDFADDLEEVNEPVFGRARRKSLSIDLQAAEAQHLRQIARSKGLKETAVVRQWILQRLQQFSSIRRGPGNVLRPPSRTRPRG